MQLEPCNALIILGTSVVSYLGFNSAALEEKYIFEPERILAGKEYYRLVTSAFLHADWRHLLLNMVSLYMFGNVIEASLGKGDFLLIYFGAIIGGDLLSLYVHRHHEYRSYGASGGVCGIIFAHILLFPSSGVAPFLFPFYVPGWLYAIGFIAGSFFAMKAGRDRIGHDAHLGGAVVGLLIAAALEPWSVRENWPLFSIVLVLAVSLLIYLRVNPLLLPLGVFAGRPRLARRQAGSATAPPSRAELKVDAILEKVNRSGMESLNPDEKRLLEETSGKYRRRGESEKPKSGLTI